MRLFRSWRLVPLLLSLALAGFILFDVGMSEADVAVHVTPSVVVVVLMRHLPGFSHLVPPLPPESDRPPTPEELNAPNSLHRQHLLDDLVWNSRMPRVVGGVLIGMLLAMAGVAFQSFLMNPLADPYMVGVSAGSALGSSLIILLGGTAWLAGMGQPLAAFAGGMLAMLFIAGIARIGGRISAQTFLLAGFVVGAFVYSLTKLVVALANRSGDTGRATAILSQLLGSLALTDWRSVLLLLPFGLLGGLLLWFSARELDIMTRGEITAASLGVDTEAFKRRIIVAGSLVTAATVAVAGIIGFVGMVVPHLARRLVGPNHSRLLPTAMLLGGLVLVASDWLSRVYLNQLEVGVITSLFGAPVFCYLLRRRLVSRW
jgi:iron complex transport system permease protein